MRPLRERGGLVEDDSAILVEAVDRNHKARIALLADVLKRKVADYGRFPVALPCLLPDGVVAQGHV